ncbi:MAG TPA: prepilin-type N-terminal cleavage/methylation domain-containing protein [Planctomycetota bacterium]|nr:prepilin-type N-terminal cleavage/methylation domain-containing protein [Planctomycetota bacterium]
MKTRGPSRGFTLLEVMIAVTILVLSIVGLVGVITYTTTQNEINRENLLAMRAAEGKIEEMKQYATKEIFARYSTTAFIAALWPTGTVQGTVGTLPGPDFSATLAADPTYSRLQNVSALISFPQNGTPSLYENWADPDPIARDLNANGIQDDPTLNYVVLPTTITLSWKGIKGARTISYKYLFYVRS